MKRITITALCLLAASSFHLHSADSATNLLSIHISYEAVRESDAAHKFRDGTVQPDNIKSLQPVPILTGEDFLLYLPTNGNSFITPAATQRLLKQLMPVAQPRRLSDGKSFYFFENADLPFVLYLSGKPVMVGVFASPYSSFRYPLPTILPAFPSIPAEGEHSACLQISFHHLPGKNADLRQEQFLEAMKKLGF